MTRSASIFSLLQRYESRNVTFIDEDGSWPVVWEEARGAHVLDAEGRRYLDLTAAFGVAASGHANARVVREGQRQMATLLHAMGDVHPHPMKAQLARKLSRITFERWSRSGRSRNRGDVDNGKTIFCNSGFEAVEAALKTAMLATGRPGIVAFEGAYHGLGYGTLNTTYRDHFRWPWLDQLAGIGHFVPFPRRAGDLKRIEQSIRRLLGKKRVGAILVEPIQGRGGINVPPATFLPLLRRLCDDSDTLLVLDEIYTGFGRTGRWFACEHSGVVPDLICLGKALTGGFPLSACIGRADLMDAAWPKSTGEALHTSTFLGHPVGCAMALAQIDELRRLKLVERSARTGERLMAMLRSEIPDSKFQMAVRGAGLMVGLELRRPDGEPATEAVLQIIKRMLHCGFILLPEGEHASVIAFTPPLIITEAQLRRAVRALRQVITGL